MGYQVGPGGLQLLAQERMAVANFSRSPRPQDQARSSSSLSSLQEHYSRNSRPQEEEGEAGRSGS